MMTNGFRYLCAIALMTLVMGCDKKDPEGKTIETKPVEEFVAGSKATEFTAALTADPETMDPAKMSGAVEGEIAMNLFEGLLMPGPTTEGLADTSKLLNFGVAESYTLSEDARTYTFKLRSDAKWTNGEPVTSEDFAFSWRRVLTNGFPADYASMMWVIDGAEGYKKAEAGTGDWETVGVKTPDAQTLVVTLVNPTPYFPELTAFYTFFPVPKKAVEEKGDEWTKPENIVSNGPYRLASYQPQQEIKFELNEHYWDKAAVNLKSIRFRIISDSNARVNAYKTGELHWAGSGLPVAQITALLTHPDFKQEPLLGTYYYRVNVSKADSPTTNVLVRQALSLAIDRDSLVNNTLNGLYKPAESFVPPMPGYSSTTKTAYNIKRAKDLLAEAGYPNGKDFPAVELLYNTDENHKLVAESVQAMWKQNLNIDVKLNNKEWKTYLQDVDTMAYQVARAGWIGDFNDPMTFLDMWTAENGNNDTGWADADYDALIKSAQQEVDKTKRIAILQQAETILLERGPIIPIYYYSSNLLMSRFVKGFQPHNRDVHLFKYMSLPSK
jgi:oligopeptide transport system substrate-binding protein